MEGISPEANLLLRSFCLIRYSLESALFYRLERYRSRSPRFATFHGKADDPRGSVEDAGGVSQRFLSALGVKM